jgi:serine/threonine-protein kinase RsbW
LVDAAARAAGVPEDRAADLVLVVNELVGNAVRYAGGTGRITVDVDATGVRVEIADQGPGLPGAATGGARPAPTATGGRGLWMARRMFPDLTIASSPAGVTVTVFAAAG